MVRGADGPTNGQTGAHQAVMTGFSAQPRSNPVILMVIDATACRIS
jgi:hypothetical protein